MHHWTLESAWGFGRRVLRKLGTWKVEAKEARKDSAYHSHPKRSFPAASQTYTLVDLSVRVLLQPMRKLMMLESRDRLRPRLGRFEQLGRRQDRKRGQGRRGVCALEESRRRFSTWGVLSVGRVGGGGGEAIDLVGRFGVAKGVDGLDQFEGGEVDDESAVGCSDDKRSNR
jgi:hypothetical protein